MSNLMTLHGGGAAKLIYKNIVNTVAKDSSSITWTATKNCVVIVSMSISQSYNAAVGFYVTVNGEQKTLDYNRGEMYTGGGAGLAIAVKKGDIVKAYKSYSNSNGAGVICLSAVG